MEEVGKKQEVKPSKYQGRQYIKFSVKNKRGYEVTRFALHFNKREGFYYCYSSKHLSGAKDKIFCRRPTWADVASASLYMLSRMKAGQWEEFGKLRDYSIQRNQYVDLRFSPVLVGKTSRVALPVTIEDNGEIMEDSFHLSYSTAMKTLLLLMRTEPQTAVAPEEVKVEAIE